VAVKGKILVVDDDRLVLAMLRHGLSQAGYEVIDADNGSEAILLAREQRPDLALLDIRMEGMTGFEVAEALRITGRVPFMFLSAFSDDATRERVRALGALDHLVKPVDMQRILPAVEQAFARLRTAQPANEPSVARDDPLSSVVAIAVGIVMHRFSLPRAQALDRLRRLAASQGHTLQAECERVVAATELLAAPGSL
jgi:response regulator NasT